MNHFFAWVQMGGYCSYVWSAYGLVCCVFIINGLMIRWKKQRTKANLRQWLKR